MERAGQESHPSSESKTQSISFKSKPKRLVQCHNLEPRPKFHLDRLRQRGSRETQALLDGLGINGIKWSTAKRGRTYRKTNSDASFTTQSASVSRAGFIHTCRSTTGPVRDSRSRTKVHARNGTKHRCASSGLTQSFEGRQVLSTIKPG